MSAIGLWKIIKTPNGKNKMELDIKQLQVRLQSIVNSHNIEIMQLAIQSVIEELDDNQHV